MQAPNITNGPNLFYIVPNAHLDTQWRREFSQTINLTVCCSCTRFINS
jgi:hypothetical protein